VLENVPLSRVTEKSNFSTLNIGLAGTRNRTRATCMQAASLDAQPSTTPVGCSLQVVGRLLRDMGRIPGDASRVRQEVGRIFFTVSFSLILPFSRERKEDNCCCYEE
jgi:hypothetical protein